MAARRATTLGPVQLLALGVNGIIGVGIFFAPSQVAAQIPGTEGLWVYILAFAALLPVAVIYASLGARYPENGGPYVWAKAAFGPQVAFFIGWLTVVSAIFSAGAVVSGFALHAAAHLGLGSSVRPFGVGVVLLLGVVVGIGLKPSAQAWTTFSILKLLALGLVVGLWLAVGPESTHRTPAASSGSWTRAALVVTFAMQGFEVVPVLAREARSSRRFVPMATISCLGLVSLLYILVHYSCAAALPGLAASERPLVETAEVLGGHVSGRFLVLGTNLSALGLAFGMFAVTPHYFAVLSSQPGFGWLGQTSKRHVPQRALVVMSIAVGCLVLVGELAQLLVLSSVAVISQYGLSGLSLLRLIQHKRHGLAWRHAWPVPLALGALGLLLTGARLSELLVTLVVVLVGAVLYLVSRWRLR